MNKEKLIAAGIDYDEGTERFGGHPEIFEKYLKKFFSGDLMDQIGQKLTLRDTPGAFRVTHDLKSAAGNLSLTDFYKAVCELTELLRNGTPDTDYTEAFQRLKARYEKARKAMEEAQ